MAKLKLQSKMEGENINWFLFLIESNLPLLWNWKVWLVCLTGGNLLVGHDNDGDDNDDIEDDDGDDGGDGDDHDDDGDDGVECTGED